MSGGTKGRCCGGQGQNHPSSSSSAQLTFPACLPVTCVRTPLSQHCRDEDTGPPGQRSAAQRVVLPKSLRGPRNSQLAPHTHPQPRPVSATRLTEPGCSEQLAPAVPTACHSHRGPLPSQVGTSALVSPAPCVCGEIEAVSLGPPHAVGARAHSDMWARFWPCRAR